MPKNGKIKLVKIVKLSGNKMSDKRYFKIEYDEEWYLFDSTTISEQLVKEQAEYGYGVFANSLSPSEVVGLLNEQQSTIKKLQDLCGESDSENAKLRIENKKLQEEIKLLKPVNVEQYEQIVQLQEENRELRQQLKEKEEDEQLYANEIVKLNKEAKEVLDFKNLGGDY